MTVGIVPLFEVIHIKHRHSKRGLLPLCFRHYLIRLFIHPAPVRDAGECIHVRLLHQEHLLDLCLTQSTAQLD